jgi:hypothetical protein
MSGIISISRRLAATLAFVVMTAPSPGAEPASAPGPLTPVGFRVFYARTDGKPFDNGSRARTYGVTRSWSERTQWFNTIDAHPQFRPRVDELFTEAEYRNAMALWAANARTPANQPPYVPVGGTKWNFLSVATEFQKTGDVVMGTRTGHWSQNGNVVTWTVRSPKGYVFTYTGHADGRSMTTYVSVVNPRSVDPETPRYYGVGTRVGGF